MILTMANAGSDTGRQRMIIAIVGATGTGKSTLSLDLSERLAADGQRCEIINADAMQLYRGMDIGTAKVRSEDRRAIPHHLLDVLSPAEDANVAAYQAAARAAVTAVIERGAVPILVGGSGLYVSSVIFDFEFPGTDAVVRQRLEAELIDRGPGIMFRALSNVDPQAAEAIGPHNGRRLVRALEVVEITGRPFGSGLPDEASYRQPTQVIGLSTPRELLVSRLDERVSQIWRAGIVAEVDALRGAGIGVTASRAIGYSQAIAQLDGQLTEAEAIEQTQALTRKYARRQVGWFRRYPRINWMDSDDVELVEHTRQLFLSNA